MKSLVKLVLGLIGVLLVLVAGTAAWAKITTDQTLERFVDIHEVEIPVPFPLTAAEVESLRAERAATLPVEDAGDPLAGVDLDAVALERAVARGEHLVRARYACGFCHGEDYGGGTMIDEGPIGRFLGPNLTGGTGSVTRDRSIADWDRILRHGVKADGRPALMPVEALAHMSDRELSDIVAFLRSVPPVDRAVGSSSVALGGALLIAFGQFPLGPSHTDPAAAHAVEPPGPESAVAFGAHVGQMCKGCHGPELAGGPGGDPSWPPAQNLTPHPDGLEGWTFEQFRAVLVEGVRRDGTPTIEPMKKILPLTREMSEEELRSIWAWLRQLPAKPTPE